MKIAISNVCSAFGGGGWVRTSRTQFTKTEVIGTRVLDPEYVMSTLEQAVSAHQFETERVPGQAFLPLPAPPQGFGGIVRAGVGQRTENPADYHARVHRGRVDLYLKPDHAAPVEGWAAVVYTVAAYLADPEVEDVEARRIKDSSAEYVLVALLAFAGPRAPVCERRFVSNLAGGNREYDVMRLDEIRGLAVEVRDYHDHWCTVAEEQGDSP